MKLFKAYSKYRAKRTVVDGITFASMAEAELYRYLTLLKVPVICQPKVYLTKAKILMQPDFKEANKAIFYEMKGKELATWRIKRKLWKYYGPGFLLIYKMRGNKPYLYETINPGEASSE